MDLRSLAALLQIPPGATPVEVNWAEVESWLGLELPSDYKQLVTAYGPLDIGEFIWVQTPCIQVGEAIREYDYATWLRETRRQILLNTPESGQSEPPVVHPDRGGLLAWGETRGGHYLLWDTGASTDPDQWPIVLFDRPEARGGRDPWRRYDMSALEFLAQAVRHGLPLSRDGRDSGPLPARARRSVWLVAPQPWTPPPVTEVTPERRAALRVGTGLDALRLLVPPPVQPYLGGGSWGDVFEELGVELPAEYIELMQTYGAGSWRGWLRTFIPLRRTFAIQVASVLDGYRELRENHPDVFLLPVWPEPGGFLPFADSIEGDYLGWLTEGEADGWPLIVNARHSEQEIPLPNGLVDTLLEWTRGRAAYAGLPQLHLGDDLIDYAIFDPATPEWPA